MDNKKKSFRKNVIITIIVIVLYILLLCLTYQIDRQQKAEALAIAPISAKEDVSQKIDLSITFDLSKIDNTVSGNIIVTNNGKGIADITNGATDVCLGVSLVDSENNIILQDYRHFLIKEEGAFVNGEQAEISISFDDLADYENCAGLRAAIVQENVAWLDNTATFWMFE